MSSFNGPALPEHPPGTARQELALHPKKRVRMRIARFLLRQAFRALELRKAVYQPVQLGSRRRGGIRDFDARWISISASIAAYGAKNILDIGCAEGWLVRRCAAELGCFAIGVDAADRIIVGEVARLHDGVKRMGLIQAHLTAEDIRALPRFDVVVCLSVVHHVMREAGTGAARAFVRAIASRAEKAVIFEMGTSDERLYSWATALPDMPEGQEAFVRGFLETCGLVNIRVIGSTERYPGATRLLFSAEPAAAGQGRL